MVVVVVVVAVVLVVDYTVQGHLAAVVAVVTFVFPSHSFVAIRAHGQTLRTWVCVDLMRQVSVAQVLHVSYP